MSATTPSSEESTVHTDAGSTSDPRAKRGRAHWFRSHAVGGETMLLIGAAAAITLVILALAGIAPRALTAIASVAVGAGLIGRGAVLTKRHADMPAPPGVTKEHATIGEAAADEVLGGTAAIVLGLVALVGLAPVMLLGVSAIATGSALVLSGGSRPKLAHAAGGEPEQGRAGLIAASAALIVAGLAAVTLGLVAVIDVSYALALLEVAFLCLGGALLASALLTGSSLVRRSRPGTVEEELAATAG